MAKTVKKIVTMLLTISMLPAILPMQSASAAGKELFSEDFEGYAVGAVTIEGNKAYDSEGKLIPTSHVSLKSSDHLRIEEENGNKYLAIYTDRNNTSNRTTVALLFDEGISGGTKEVSYDIMPKAHYACFRRLGILTYDKSSYTEKNIQRLMTQGANIITKLQNTVFGWTSDFQSSKFGGKFGTITQTIDYENDANNYNVILKYGTTTRSKTLTVADIATKPIYGIVWDFSSNESGGANGSDSPFVDNGVSYGVYCIDNVKVTTIGLSVQEENIVSGSTISVYDNVEITFDDTLADDFAEHVSVLKDGEVLSEDKYTLSLSDDKKTMTVSSFDYNSSYTVKVDKTITSANGKPIAGEYELNFKTNSIISHNITKERYEEGFIPSVSPVSGINYEYAISKDVSEFETYDFSALDEKGSYSLKIIATDENGKKQTEIIDFDIVGAVAPEAKDITIAAYETLGVGAELIGKYTYFDSNDEDDENMDYCTYQWYRSSSENGVFAAIEGATGISYTLTAEDEDKFIKFGVKPYSTVEPKEGKESLSDAFVSFMNPTASNVSIIGKTVVGEQLSVSYEYSDLNGDVENTDATEITWYISEAFGGEYIEVGSGKNYTVKNDDSNKYIKACVIPKNNGSGKQDKRFYSHSVKILDKEYFSEDFEGYDVGVIATGPINTISATRNVGGLCYKLAEGDVLEIVEKDGSKTLKFTANSEITTERQIFLDFDKHYGNNKIYDVGFDYYVENNSVWFNDFGTLYDDDVSDHPNYVHSTNYNPIKIVSSYRDSLYFNGNTNSENYISGSLLASSSGYWKHQNTKIDFSKDPKTLRITTSKTSDGTQLATKETTVTYTYGGKSENILADNISSISWRFKKNGTAGWNGQDEGNGVYYIDNITLKASGIAVVNSVVGKDRNVVITFDSDIADNADEHIGVFKSGELVTADKYGVSVSGKAITVSELDYNSDYEVKVYDTIASTSGMRALSEYAVNFRTPSLMNYDSVSGKHSVGYIPAVDTVSGATYKYYLSNNSTEFSAYNKTPITDIGKYELKVVAEDVKGKTQTEIIGFEIVGEIPPEVKNVNIECSGAIGVGTILSGTYEYFDANDEIRDANKDYCIYKWYRSDSKDGVFSPIPGANGVSYTLTAEDEDKFVKFGVKPYSKVEPKEGEEALSGTFVSFMNPVVSNIEIVGKMATNEQITVSYDYSDLNGDAEITEGENSTTIIWYTSSTENGVYSEVGRGRNYTITGADSDKWIKASVIPKNSGAGNQNNEFYSESVQGAFSPVVSDVKLIGNANVGSTMSVDYRFYDVNQDSEGVSYIEWYVGGERVSDGNSYTISSGNRGKSIYAVVTPHSSAEPINGKPVQSDTKTISNSAQTVTLGGGDFGGGTGGGGITIPANNGGNATGQKGFRDISGHWAEKAISNMVDQGIIFGKSANEFAPEDKITRAEFAALISRMFKLTDDGYTFNDISEDSWYRSSVAAVAAAGYMTGAYGNFRPEDNITREEMAVVISLITTANGIETHDESASFADFDDISDWAKNAVSAMKEIGIINGMDDNSFMPKGEATRAQTVIMLTMLQSVLSVEN